MQPKIYCESDHHIDPSLIDSDALYVLHKLRQAGFIAYLVGGSVRDLLIKRRPKDFDISTDARPEQIKAVFQRQCLLIGRRFRLAHIRFGHKVIEVATFRSGENVSDLITQDNVWGSEQEDVLRRDFTINGLFYDAATHSIIDYVDGWSDIQNHLLRIIGDPEMRFKQDPVRLIRLLKFQARYGFKIDPETAKCIASCLPEIKKSSPARVLEEILRMLESGYAQEFFRLMAHYHLLDLLFPALTKWLHSARGKKVFHYLACADQLYHHKGKNVLDRSALTACLLFPILEIELKNPPHIGDITLTAATLVKSLLIHPFTHFPRRITSQAVAILVSQYRITPLSKKRHSREKLFHSKEFVHALAFFKLRAMVNESHVELYKTMRDQYHHFLHQREKKPHSPPQKSKPRSYRKRASHAS